MTPSDGSGLIKTKDGNSQLNFFRMRLDLAHIEGEIYDLLYSCRSMRVQRLERQHRIGRLQAMLDCWYARIPLAFRIDRVSATVGDVNMLPITKLYHTYLQCIISTHGVYSSRADWMRRVSSLCRVAIQDFATAIQGPKVVTCLTQDPPLTGGWNHCVEISRASVKLFQCTSPTEILIWSALLLLSTYRKLIPVRRQCSCVHFSGLVIVLANILLSPTHKFTSVDLQIATKSIHLLESLLDVVQSPTFEPLQRIIMDLYRSAVRAVDEVRPDWLNEAETLDPITTGQNEGDLDIVAEETTFSEFDWNDSELRALEFNDIFNPFLESGEFSSI